jgi:hypothetical protein
VIIEFTGDVWFWKGPAPWYFVTVPPDHARSLREILSTVTYGWGMIPVSARIGDTEWTTAMWPKDGSYILPIKSAVRKAEKLEEGDTVRARLEMLISNL